MCVRRVVVVFFLLHCISVLFTKTKLPCLCLVSVPGILSVHSSPGLQLKLGSFFPFKHRPQGWRSGELSWTPEVKVCLSLLCVGEFKGPSSLEHGIL